MISQSRQFLIFLFVLTFIATHEAAQQAKAETKAKLDDKNEFLHVFGSVLWHAETLGMSDCVTERDKTLLSARIAIDVSISFSLRLAHCFSLSHSHSRALSLNRSCSPTCANSSLKAIRSSPTSGSICEVFSCESSMCPPV